MQTTAQTPRFTQWNAQRSGASQTVVGLEDGRARKIAGVYRINRTPDGQGYAEGLNAKGEVIVFLD